MQLSEFLDFDAIKPSLSAGNKRALLQQLAQFAAARLGVDPGEVLSSISERERHSTFNAFNQKVVSC